MLIDTHAHINLHAFRHDAGEVMQRALEAGVGVINVGTELHTSRQAVAMLEQYPQNVYATVGLHPSHTYDNPYLDENESAFATSREEFDYDTYKELASNPKVVGIGECGLDYYRLDGDTNNTNEHANDTNSTSPNLSYPDVFSRGSDRSVGGRGINADSAASRAEVSSHLRQGYGGQAGSSPNIGEARRGIIELQKNAFEQQIELAQELDKALVIHCRPSKETNDAYEDVFGILSSLKSHSSRLDLRFEIHSFTGPLEVAQKFIALGGYIGLNGIITFDRTGNMEKVVKGVPLQRIVLETDSPYLSPSPYRGKRNEPVYVELVAQKIAGWHNMSSDEISEITTSNAKLLFNIS